MTKKFTLLPALLVIFAFAQAQTQYTFHNARVIPLTLERISKPVRDLPEQKPHFTGPTIERENESLHREMGEPNPNAIPKGADPAVQKNYNRDKDAPAAVTVDVLSNWPGLTANVVPSDDNIAVGTNDIVQMTNNSTSSYMRVWNKAGTVLVASKTIESFSGIADYGDPNIVYDQAADRYAFVLLYSANGDKLEVCVSKTNDPTGSWYVYSFKTSNGFPDYPKIGVWGNSYIITTNSNTPTIFALDRASMLAGSGTGTAQAFDLSSFPKIGFQSSSPVSLIGSTLPPTNAPANVVRVFDNSWDASLGPDAIQIFSLSINWTTPSSSTITGPLSLSTSSYNSKLCSYTSTACIPQKGSTQKVDPLSNIAMDKVQYRNFGDHEAMVLSCVCNANGKGEAGVRWYELRRVGSGEWTIYQQSTYYPTSSDRWMSSITINDNGTIAMGYNISSSTIDPGFCITGRDSCDALNDMTVVETQLENGTAANASNRYGDYNGMVTDPTDGSFWFTAQYNLTTIWTTNLVHFTFSSCANPAGDLRSLAGINQPDDLLGNSLSILPNPATDEVKVLFTSRNSDDAVIKVFDMTGKTVFVQNQAVVAADNQATIDVHALANGYYFVNVRQGSNSVTRKLAIAR